MSLLPNLATCKKIGFIVPSSNTAVEPITQAIFQSLTKDNIICIFTRIRVQTVGIDSKSTSQFSVESMVQAARLLADAEPDCIVWNGTSGMWISAGLEEERKFAQAMQDATGIPCSTTTLATVEALQHLNAKRISIAVPYPEAMSATVAGFFTGCGFEVVTTERLKISPRGNREIAMSDIEDIKDIVERSATGNSEAVVVACTNWPATGLAEQVERDCAVVVVDSISITAWKALMMIGYKKGIDGWGKMLAQHLT